MYKRNLFFENHLRAENSFILPVQNFFYEKSKKTVAEKSQDT
jgi:hypothetical protein